MLYLCFFTLFLIAWRGGSAELLPESQVTVYNHAGAAINPFWLDFHGLNNNKTQLKKVVETVKNGNFTTINSFVSHKFVIRLARHREGVQTVFVKGSGDEEIHVYYDSYVENLYVHYIPQQPPNASPGVKKTATKPAAKSSAPNRHRVNKGHIERERVAVEITADSSKSP